MSTVCLLFHTKFAAVGGKLLILKGRATVSDGRHDGHEVTPEERSNRELNVKPFLLDVYH